MELLWMLVQAAYAVACVLLIFLILIQESKGEGLTGVFGGGGGSQTLFGSSAPTVVHRATIYCAVLFIGLGFLLMFRTPSQKPGGSIMEGMGAPPVETAPETGAVPEAGTVPEGAEEAAPEPVGAT